MKKRIFLIYEYDKPSVEAVLSEDNQRFLTQLGHWPENVIFKDQVFYLEEFGGESANYKLSDSCLKL